MPTFSSTHELHAAIDQELGPSEWLEITQDRIDRFAEARETFNGSTSTPGGQRVGFQNGA